LDRGLSGVERFAALPADQPIKSFCLSQYAMLKSFLATGKDTLLALEDDAIFQEYGHLAEALRRLPEDWDIIYLGANITPMVTGIQACPPMASGPSLYRVFRAWTTHAIGYSRKMVERLVKEYDGVAMYDAWLSEGVLPTCNAYLINPMVAYQRPGLSDLWGQETDYTGAFIHGDKIMSV
jgi:GR25 family glycosyltransferase involved in LPS biosynthesis